MRALRFLHHCIQHLSTVVCYLSYLSFLPSAYLQAILHASLLSPPIITTAVILTSFTLSLSDLAYEASPTQHAHTQHFSLPKWLAHYLPTRCYPYFFGISKGIQSLTVIRYFEASLGWQQDFSAPLTATIIGAISMTVYYCNQSAYRSLSAYVATETINFVLNATTAFGYLYLLNQTAPWSLPSLVLGLAVLISLSIFIETKTYHSFTQSETYQRTHTFIQTTIRSFSPERRRKPSQRRQQHAYGPSTKPDNSQAASTYLSSFFPVISAQSPLLSLKTPSALDLLPQQPDLSTTQHNANLASQTSQGKPNCACTFPTLSPSSTLSAP